MKTRTKLLSLLLCAAMLRPLFACSGSCVLCARRFRRR